MKRFASPLLVLLLCMVLLASCATKTEYVTQTEYVPVYIDLTDVVGPVLRFRPDNSTYVIKTGNNLKTTFDVIDNANQYLKAWEDWEHYATALEGTLMDIRDRTKADVPEPAADE